MVARGGRFAANSGPPALVLVIPGIILCWRRGRFFRQVAIVWICGLVAMHITAAREVRYIAFLMPLTAILVAVAIRWLWRKRKRWAMILVLPIMLDICLAGKEAVRVCAPYYRTDQLQVLFDLIDTAPGQPAMVFAPGGNPFFVTRSADIQPFGGDWYHRLHHINRAHLQFAAPQNIRVLALEEGGIWFPDLIRNGTNIWMLMPGQGLSHNVNDLHSRGPEEKETGAFLARGETLLITTVGDVWSLGNSPATIKESTGGVVIAGDALQGMLLFHLQIGEIIIPLEPSPTGLIARHVTLADFQKTVENGGVLIHAFKPFAHQTMINGGTQWVRNQRKTSP